MLVILMAINGFHFEFFAGEVGCSWAGKAKQPIVIDHPLVQLK